MKATVRVTPTTTMTTITTTTNTTTTTTITTTRLNLHFKYTANMEKAMQLTYNTRIAIRSEYIIIVIEIKSPQ